MELKDLVNLNKGDIASIVGAGGKTTLMYSLAQELRYESKVLITTTTKIYMPQKECYDFFVMGENNFYKHPESNGIYIYGKAINEENKIIGLSKTDVESGLLNFDYVLIEADGSKKRSIKGWRCDEPVISSNTNKTIGVLSIDAFGKVINDINVHRMDKFRCITNSKEEELISIQHLAALVFHEKGLFKDAVGKRILFINKVDGSREVVLANQLLKLILEKNSDYLGKIIIGSLKNKEYRCIEL